MKKILSLCLIIICNYNTFSQVDLKKKIVDSTCACLSNLPGIEKMSPSDLQTEVGKCMMQKSLSDFMALAQERNIELTDQDAMQKLGVEIGMELVKSNCKAMNAIMQSMASSNTNVKAPKDNNDFTVKGTIQSIMVKDFVYINVLSKGKTIQLVWSDYVENGDTYTSDFSKLKGKNIEFNCIKKDILNPKLKSYVPVKMILAIN